MVSIPSICSDATLPATAELRGVVPLIDPAVTGSDVENANSKTSLTTPFDANGLSVAEIMAAQGFSNLTAVAADGTKAAAGGAATGAASGASSNAASGAAGNGTADASNGNASAGNGGKKSCNSKGKGKGSNSNAGANANNNAGNNNNDNNNNGAAANAGAANNGTAAATGGQTSLAGADFGKCVPTMDFQFGRAGRKATEGTFLPTDALVAQGQQDALNPNIITNRICDQLTNVCEANQAAKDACQSAKSSIQELGTKDASTATAFNQALGF